MADPSDLDVQRIFERFNKSAEREKRPRIRRRLSLFPSVMHAASGDPPVNTVAPTISGNDDVGEVLTCTTGTWTGAETIVYTYQWRRAGVAISGETASTYTTEAPDVGSAIDCVVTATNDDGSASQASSNSITVVGEEVVEEPSPTDGDAPDLDNGTIIYDGGFSDTPTFNNNGNGKKASGTSTNYAKFLFSIGVPVAGTVYTMTYDPDFTGLTDTGKLAMVGFGFKQGQKYHFAGLRGDGTTGLDAYKVHGNNFNTLRATTEVDGGAATHGTQAGPNWLQIEIAIDGTTYTLRTSADGATWADEFTDDLPTPLSEATDATDFGVAIYLDANDKGPFEVDITLWQQVVLSAPAQFGTGDWSVADDGTGGDITITITALPDDGNSAITDLEYQIDGGSWVSLGGTTTGAYPISGLTDAVEVDVAIRAVNAIGDGAASATKAVTPTAATKRVVVVNFVSRTTNGTQTITDSRLEGLTPKGAILFHSRNENNKGNAADMAHWSFGMTDGTTQWGTEFRDVDSESSEATLRAANVTWMAQNTSGVAIRTRDNIAAFSAFVSEGITLSWTNTTGVALLCTLVLFAGDDVEVKAGVIEGGLSTTPLAVNAGFQPGAVLFAAVGLAAHDDEDITGTRSTLGFSVDTGSGISEQGVAAARDAGSNNEATAWSNTQPIRQVTPAGALSGPDVQISSYGASGFSVTADTTRSLFVYYLAIKIDGASFFAGNDFAKTSTGTQAKTGVGFQPDVGIFLTTRGPVSGGAVSTSEMGLGAFAVDADLTHGGNSFYSLSAGVSQSNCTASNSAIIQQKTDGAMDYDFTVQSWDSDGYTLNFADAADAAYALPVLLIGGLE